MMTKSPEPTLETLGSRIRERRKSLGLSQEELGRRLAMELHQISRIERGLRDPSVLMLHRLAAALQCKVAALLGEPPAVARTPPPHVLRVMPPPGDDGISTAATSSTAAPTTTMDRSGDEIQPDEVRRFRSERRLSQQRLGELCGVAQSTVFRWEAGEAPSGPAAIVLRQLLAPKASLLPLTVTEERLFDELLKRGNFRSRQDYLASALTQLILSGAGSYSHRAQ